jgi:hypothetical protein
MISPRFLDIKALLLIYLNKEEELLNSPNIY